MTAERAQRLICRSHHGGSLNQGGSFALALFFFSPISAPRPIFAEAANEGSVYWIVNAVELPESTIWRSRLTTHGLHPQ